MQGGTSQLLTLNQVALTLTLNPLTQNLLHPFKLNANPGTRYDF